jgi:hypothetical protein
MSGEPAARRDGAGSSRADLSVYAVVSGRKHSLTCSGPLRRLPVGCLRKVRFVVARDTGCDETGAAKTFSQGVALVIRQLWSRPRRRSAGGQAVCCWKKNKRGVMKGTVRMLHGTTMFLLVGEKSLGRNRPWQASGRWPVRDQAGTLLKFAVTNLPKRLTCLEVCQGRQGHWARGLISQAAIRVHCARTVSAFPFSFWLWGSSILGPCLPPSAWQAKVSGNSSGT